MTIEAKKKATVRRGRALGEIYRGPKGEVSMIILNPWRENPLAPVTLVSHIGGIQRLPDGLIKVTLVNELPTVSGALEYVAAGHYIWSSEHRWTDANDAFKWVMQRFREGVFRRAIPDDGGGRRQRTQ